MHRCFKMPPAGRERDGEDSWNLGEYEMDLGLKGKVALVTGASQGMGWAMALGFAREGAKVSICARGEGLLNQAAEMIRGETGGEALATVGDLTHAEGI